MPEMLPRLLSKSHILLALPASQVRASVVFHLRRLLVFGVRGPWVFDIELKSSVFTSPLDSPWISIVHVVRFQFFPF